MKIVDLSYTIHEDMPVYKGDPNPRIQAIACHETEGLQVSNLFFCAHTGTHVDVPRHFISDGNTTETHPISQFMGRAIVLDVSHVRTITDACFKPLEERIGLIDFVLFYTGVTSLKESIDQCLIFDDSALTWLLCAHLKGIGTDVASIDSDQKAHQILLGHGFVVYENLCHLKELGNEIITFSGLPLKINGGDGSPVRAIALLD